MAGLVLSVLFTTWLLAIWIPDYARHLKPVYGTGVASTKNTAIPVGYGAERNKVVYSLRISKVPGVGPGEELHGTASDCG